MPVTIKLVLALPAKQTCWIW